MHRLPTQLETLEAFEAIERAIKERHVVEVSFFKELKDERGYTRWFADSPRLMRIFGRRPMLTAVPVRRTVEPVRLDWSMQGHPYMEVISYASPGEERPAARIIRLDRVAIGTRGMRLRVTPRRFMIAGTMLDPTAARA